MDLVVIVVGPGWHQPATPFPACDSFVKLNANDFVS
jgi:hypothetical protein